MSDLQQGEREELIRVLNRFSAKADALLLHGNQGNAQITVTGNGPAVWVALLMVQTVILAAIIVLFAKADRAQDHLNAIYMQAPSLKQPEKAK